MSMTTTAPTTAPTPLEAAHTYARLGYCVVPISPGKKHPPIPGWQDAATTDPTIIDSWWTGLYRGHGIGIATGPRSNIWVLDIDVTDGKPGRENLEALLAEHGPLPLTVTAATGSGGRHFLFTWDPARPITNGHATHLPPGLDIRGDGGQIVVAPTIHPNGQPYTWREGRAPWDLAVADAPDWLYQLMTPPEPNATSVVEIPQQMLHSPSDQEKRATAPEDSAAAWIRAQHDWRTVLTRDGWTEMHTRGDDTYWCRPGKNPRDGHSAVQHGDDGPLVIFTTEVPIGLGTAGKPTADGSGLSVSMFGYLAGTRYNGDRSACARDARLAINALQKPPSGLTILTPPPPANNGQGPTQGPAAVTADDGDPFAHFGSWTPADLATYLDPNWKPEPPTLLTRDDGRALWYRGNVNWLHGASGEGKTWVALIAAAQEIQAGRDVVWVHYEDPLPDKIANRLVLLGVDRAAVLERFHVCCVGSASMVDGIPFLRAVITHFGAELVIIDSIGEAIGSDGVAVKEDEKFVAWIHQTCRVLAADGNTVLGIDHLPMGEPGRLDPVGSFRKKAATTGSMFLAESPNPPAQGKAGYIKLTCAKDRSGLWTKGEVAAIIHMAPAGDGIEVAVTAPSDDAKAAGGGEPETISIARHAYRAVAKRGQLSQRGLVASMTEVRARQTVKQRGIDFAVLQGWLVESEGSRGARMFDVGVEPPSANDLLNGWEG